MPPFTVETDVEGRALSIVMRGYWDQATFDAFALVFEKALIHMHRTGGLATALVDGREFAVQAKAIGEQFHDLINRNRPWLARRTASVVAAQLNKLQAERSGQGLDARYFTDMDEAQAWLFNPNDPA
jgi:hypothetical protein